jgi:NAD(P)-dependent dehydrogenase (short-subunit alcohol dehydrogenase family)
LLEGVAVMLAGCAAAPAGPGGFPGGSLAAAVGETCAALGAAVSTCAPNLDVPAVEDEAALDAAVTAATAQCGALRLLAVDAAGLFAAGLARGGGHAALRACADGAWAVTRAVVNGAFLPAGRGGRVVYLAPAPAAEHSEIVEHAAAARAALENLARTLSIEWARHGITTVTVAPGAGTAAGEVATLLAYLASPAGAYFSGCLLDLRGP